MTANRAWVISPCGHRCFGSLTRGPNMKLFNMASEMGQHAIDRGNSKDTFGNMQAGPVTAVSEKENDDIHEKMRN
jgi:hypothetical protein